MKDQNKMQAMVTTGYGDFDRLEWRENYPKPVVRPGEVLIRVMACGLNNTDINTRTGWYSETVTQATTGSSFDGFVADNSAWGGSGFTFPRIQGADICGIIEAVGDGISMDRIGERIINDTWLRDSLHPNDKSKSGYVGSECDGGYAQYCVLPSENALCVQSSYTDAELATFSCSYSTAEGMLTRANLCHEDTVLITGASGGVGGALIQLAKLRGARVIGMASPDKHTEVAKLNPDLIIDRHPADLKISLKSEKITVVADVVGGDNWPALIDILERGGRYTCSGAIAGPMVSLDLRKLYLRDLTFTGSTVLGPKIMKAIVAYIEDGSLKPQLAASFSLRKLHEAQRLFIEKKHVGNIVVLP